MLAVAVGFIIAWKRLQVLWVLGAALAFALINILLFEARVRPWLTEVGLQPADTSAAFAWSLAVASFWVGLGWSVGWLARRFKG